MATRKTRSAKTRDAVPQERSAGYRFRFLFLALILLGAFLLYFRPVRQDIMTDEAKYALGIDYPGAGLVSQAFYQLQLLVGFNEYLLRFITVIFSLGLVALFYALGARHDYRFGLAMAFFGAVIPSVIILAHTVYLDIYMVFFATLALYCFLVLERDAPHGRKLLVASIGLFFALLFTFMIKPQGVLFAIPFVLYLFIRHRFAMLRRTTLWIAVASGVVFVLDYLAHPNRLGDLAAYFTSAHNAVDIRGTLINKVHNSLLRMLVTDRFTVIVLALGFFICLFLLWRACRALWNKEKLTPFIEDALLYWLFAAWLLFVYAFVLLPTFYYLAYFAIPTAFLGALLLGTLLGWSNGFSPARPTRVPRFRALRRVLAVILVLGALLCGIFTATPVGSNQNLMYQHFGSNGGVFFQDNAPAINAFFANESVVIIGGDFGHQYQYYIDKPLVRSCAIENSSSASARRAMVTNITDPRCADATEAIVSTWKQVGSIHGSEAAVTFYEKP